MWCSVIEETDLPSTLANKPSQSGDEADTTQPSTHETDSEHEIEIIETLEPRPAPKINTKRSKMFKQKLKEVEEREERRRRKEERRLAKELKEKERRESRLSTESRGIHLLFKLFLTDKS